MIDTVRLSESAKRRLTNLKRLTGIDQWNILSRWALCLSLSEGSIPPAQDNESMSSIEMTWKVFAGRHSDAYLAVVLNEYNEAKESGKLGIAEKLCSLKEKSGILIADVSGHRITDASMAAMLHQAFMVGVLYELKISGEVTSELFEILNSRFYKKIFLDRMFSMLPVLIPYDRDSSGII